MCSSDLLVIFVAVEIKNCGVLIKSFDLNQSFAFPEKFRSIWKSNPFPQPHSFPFAVRHNLLSSKKSASSSYKAAYPFVQGLEFAAVQIIAVDSVRKSGLLIDGYMMKAGYSIKTIVSTGDLNRPRESRGPRPFGYFWFFS